ncbi:MAG TPA: GNAT family N-acetyltransferase [Acidimicrobiales bacterium]|nr:GNAT family N-acetyltransferase [Acidimicrobiales bacterium]
MTLDFHLATGPLSRSDAKHAARVSARAFLDDAYFSYLLPDERARSRALELLFAAQIRRGGEHARTVTVRDERHQIVGVAVWFGPGHWPPSVGTQLSQLPVTLRALYRHPRALRLGATYINAVLKVHPKEHHWYLALIATDLTVQRRGAGTLLMNEGIEQMKLDGVGGYLETQKEENLAFYNRFGYDLRETLHPVAGGPPYFTMWKPAP